MINPARTTPVRVLWNPSAGSKAGLPTNRTDEAALRALMARHGLGADLRIPRSAEAASRAARQAVEESVPIVVAAGGDGTVGPIAFALLGTDTALGILPLGSAMNVARSLGLPRDLEAAAAILEHGLTRRMDIGRANGVPFLEIGSIGLNASVFDEAQRIDHGHYGSIGALIRAIVTSRPSRVCVVLDDRSLSARALMVTVANGPYTGLGLAFAPDARLDDGRFDVRVYARMSKWELIRHFGSILFGHRDDALGVRTYRSRRVLVEARPPLPSRVDGVDLGTTPIEFVAEAGALCVVVPPPDDVPT